MHFPDSVLSPITTTAANATMLPIWWWSGRYVLHKLTQRELPLLALGSAFAFTLMLFNLPALGGTTAHAVGGTLLAILLGPSAAILGISITLAIQALCFGDGGLWAFGANCLTMGVIMPLTGYGSYRLLCAIRPYSPRWIPIAASLGSYVGILSAALAVAILLGIQPTIAHNVEGAPLYFPFGLSITLPAMLGTHLLVAGPVEGIVTGLVVTAMLRNGIALYRTPPPNFPAQNASRRWIWGSLLGLLLLSPLGLIAQGEAWGEWSSESLKIKMQTQFGTASLPRGLVQAEQVAHRGIRGLEDYASGVGTWGYIGSGLLGAGLIIGTTLALGRKEQSTRTALPSTSERPLPDWLKKPSAATNPSVGQTRASNPYLERNLIAFTERHSQIVSGGVQEQSPLSSCDPRCKIVGLLFLLVVVGTLHSPLALTLTILLLLLLTRLAHLSPLNALRRSGFLLAVFGIAVCLPVAITSAYTPQQGLVLGITLFTRLLCALWLGWLLTQTTSPHRLLLGFRSLGVPRLVVGLVAMTYRYLDLMLLTAYETTLARRSRSVGASSNGNGRSFTGSSLANLFGKTLHTAEEVHQALLSRGFQGDFPSLQPLTWSHQNTLWLSLMLLSGVLLWLLR